jgi:hypothetical protein
MTTAATASLANPLPFKRFPFGLGEPTASARAQQGAGASRFWKYRAASPRLCLSRLTAGS